MSKYHSSRRVWLGRFDPGSGLAVVQRFHVTLQRVSLSIIPPSLVQQCLTFETHSWLLGGAAATLLPPSPKTTRENRVNPIGTFFAAFNSDDS